MGFFILFIVFMAYITLFLPDQLKNNGKRNT